MCLVDDLHCCPSGYECDTEHSRCTKGLTSSSSINQLCPDGLDLTSLFFFLSLMFVVLLGSSSCADGSTRRRIEQKKKKCLFRSNLLSIGISRIRMLSITSVHSSFIHLYVYVSLCVLGNAVCCGL